MLAIILFVFGLLTPESKAHSVAHELVVTDSIKKKHVVRRDSLGKYVTINRIFITGNRITRDQIILRELSIKTGDVIYTEDLNKLIEADKKKLLNTRLFNTVEIRSLELEEIKVDILIDVNERWYTFPAPLLELADRNLNEWWRTYNHDLRRLNYGLRLYQYNVRGRNETLRFHAQFGFSRRFELMYRFPYIDKKQKHGLSVDGNYLETKNLAYKTEEHKYKFLRSDDILRTIKYGGLTYTYRNSFFQTHSFRVEYLSADINDTIRALNPNYLKGEISEQKYASITYSFLSDHRDWVSYPLKGHSFSFILNKNGLLPDDDVNKAEALLSYAKYLDLGKQYYLSNNAIGYASTPKDLSYMNYGVLGLRRQFVRGYELYVIEGPYYVMNKTTFKKLLFSRKYHLEAMPIEQFRHVPISVYLKTYADFGYVHTYPYYIAEQENVRLSNELLAGTGIGLDVISSYDVVLRFEYSLNREGEHGFFFHIKREF